MIIQAAYGSQRHLSVYTELGLQRDQIYILSKKSSKRMPENCQVGDRAGREFVIVYSARD